MSLGTEGPGRFSASELQPPFPSRRRIRAGASPYEKPETAAGAPRRMRDLTVKPNRAQAFKKPALCRLPRPRALYPFSRTTLTVSETLISSVPRRSTAAGLFGSTLYPCADRKVQPSPPEGGEGCVRCEDLVYFRLFCTATATATVAPTMGLLPMPRKPIISTCAGTEDEPANCASECIRPIVSVMP